MLHTYSLPFPTAEPASCPRNACDLETQVFTVHRWDPTQDPGRVTWQLTLTPLSGLSGSQLPDLSTWKTGHYAASLGSNFLKTNHFQVLGTISYCFNSLSILDFVLKERHLFFDTLMF